MSWLILGFVLLLNHSILGQQDGGEMSLMDIINATEQLSEVNRKNPSVLLYAKISFKLCNYISFSLKINRYFIHLLKEVCYSWLNHLLTYKFVYSAYKIVIATVSFVKYLVSAYNYNLDFGISAVDF